LRERGVVHGGSRQIKILGDGELNAALTVRAHAFSRSAEEKIAKAGGKVERVS
jgi:large subunit ribosomal protein L15